MTNPRIWKRTTCRAGHPFVEGSHRVIVRVNKHGRAISYRDCTICSKARIIRNNNGRKSKEADFQERRATVESINNEILAIVDQLDLSTAYERSEFRARVQELTRRKDLLERRGTRRVASDEVTA